jgi:hypothetical protein
VPVSLLRLGRSGQVAHVAARCGFMWLVLILIYPLCWEGIGWRFQAGDQEGATVRLCA